MRKARTERQRTRRMVEPSYVASRGNAIAFSRTSATSDLRNATHSRRRAATSRPGVLCPGHGDRPACCRARTAPAHGVAPRRRGSVRASPAHANPSTASHSWAPELSHHGTTPGTQATAGSQPAAVLGGPVHAEMPTCPPRHKTPVASDTCTAPAREVQATKRRPAATTCRPAGTMRRPPTGTRRHRPRSPTRRCVR